MLKVKHPTFIAISGLIWLIIGTLLFTKGANWIASLNSMNTDEWYPLFDFLALFYPYPNQYGACIIAGCLLTGYLKSKLVFAKTAQKSIDRIKALPNPSSILKIYPLKYYLLIATMVSLGFFVRNSSLPTDLRAAMYLSIGFALMRSSFYFLRLSDQKTYAKPIDNSGNSPDRQSESCNTGQP